MEERYLQNLGIMSEADLERIKQAKVLLVGAGGIGGHVANLLVRLGVMELTIVDFDCFDQTNLNRQLFCTELNLGSYKVAVLKQRLKEINSNCVVNIHQIRIEDLSIEIFEQHEYVIDAVDSPKTKVYLNETCSKIGLPLLHGACAGWYLQVGWIEPDSKLLKDLYENEESGMEEFLKNPPFAPSLTASFMVSEFVKYVTNKDKASVNKLQLIDLLNNDITSTGGEDKS